MSKDLVKQDLSEEIERVVMMGDLAQLKPEQRLAYYRSVCESVGLNPLTRPFDYITLNGKLTLYARKDCTDQLRTNNQVSVQIVAREVVEDCYVVTSRATMPSGRTDESIGAVAIGGLKGEAKCNAMMKAETKSKRRATLSICGLGLLDETEIGSIPAHSLKEVKRTEEDIVIAGPAKAREPNGGQAVVAAVQEVAGPTSKPAIEYIDVGRQRNIHKEFRQAVRKDYILDKDIIFYSLLANDGFVDDDKVPTAARIPADRWFEVKERYLAKAAAL